MILTLRLMLQNNDVVSLGQMTRLYERLPVASKHKDNFLDARTKINAYLDQNTSPSLVYRRKDPGTGRIVHDETLTNRRVLELIIYGDKAHLEAEKAAIVSGQRSWEAGSALLDNTFNVVAAEFLNCVFYLQIQNAAFYEELTGKKLPIDWPDLPEPPSVK